MPGTFFLIDGNSFIYHSFFGMPPLTNAAGEQVQAAYSLVQLLQRLATREQTSHWAVAFDTAAPTFRHHQFPAYKAHRQEMPEALAHQLPWIDQILAGYQVPVLRQDGFEADDLLCTLAGQAAAAGLEVRLVSRDKDLEQVLSPRIQVWDPKDGSLYGPEELQRKKGIRPAQVIDYQALVGDSTDNVPGVPGIGPKTATKVLEVVRDLDDLFRDPPPAGVAPRILEKIRAHADDLRLSRTLVTLRTDAPVDPDLTRYRRLAPQVLELRPLLELLGFRRFLDELPAAAADPETGPTRAAPTRAPEAQRVRDLAGLATLRAAWRDAREVAVHALATAGPSRTSRVEALAVRLPGTGPVYWMRLGGEDGLPRAGTWEILKDLLEDPDHGLIVHDLKRLTLLLRNEGIRLARGRFDPMLAAYLLNPLRRSYDLTTLAGEFLGLTLPAPAAAGDPVDGATLALAAEAVWRARDALAPALETNGLLRVFSDLEQPLCDVLADMEHEGISLDLLRLQELEDQLSAAVARLTREIHREAGTEFNINSPRQLETVLFDQAGFPSARKTKTGRSTSAEVLEELAMRFPERPLPALLLEYRTLTKLLGTYVQALPRLVRPETGRLHTDFSQVAAATGRLASSDPNLQNIPVKTDLGRRIRKAFVPNRSGELFLSADYSQIELRLLAHLSGDAALIQALSAGEDIHRQVAARIQDKPAEAITAAERTAAKAVTFGVIYGMGAFGLARDLGIPREQAQAFIERFFREFPGVRTFIDATIEGARRSGEVRTLYGRRRPIPDIDARTPHRRQQAERFAVNTVVQGSAADVIKQAMIDVHTALTGTGSSARLLLQIHDELLLSVPGPEADAEEARLRALMEGAVGLAVPLRVTVSRGEDWYEASK